MVELKVNAKVTSVGGIGSKFFSHIHNFVLHEAAPMAMKEMMLHPPEPLYHR